MTELARASITVAGLEHPGLPIPAASRIGPFIATGGVRGVDRSTGRLPEALHEQVRLMFANLRALIEAAGGTCGGILKMTLWIKTNEARPLINQEWIAMFPDAHSRPARHVLNYELGGGMLIQCDALAVIGATP